MRPRTRPTIMLPLELPITYNNYTIGHYRPLALATTGAATATPHLNINVGVAGTDTRILEELMGTARTIGWDVYDYTQPTAARTAHLEKALIARKSTIRALEYNSWVQWVNNRRDRPIPQKAAPIMVAFTHTSGELDPLFTSLLVNGRIYGVHTVHVGPIEALPGAGQAMIDLSVGTSATGELALTQPPRTIPL